MGIEDRFIEVTKKDRSTVTVIKARDDNTGHSVIDAFLDTTKKEYEFKGTRLEKFMLNGRKIILVTAHRRENIGDPIMDICRAIKEIALKFRREVSFVYPVHLNPHIQKPVYSLLSDLNNVLLVEPMEYLPFVHLIRKSHFILTDSGGLQEEAPSLGKPVLVMRRTTERPEGVQAGCVEVIGTETRQIVAKVSQLLEDKKKYNQMSQAKNPYGDGKAAERIVRRILEEKL